MIAIAELLPPHPCLLWTQVHQVGVNHAVGLLPYDPPTSDDTEPFSWTKNHGSVDVAKVQRTPQGVYPWELEVAAGAAGQLRRRRPAAGRDREQPAHGEGPPWPAGARRGDRADQDHAAGHGPAGHRGVVL